jgi:hypothetical protein
VNSSRAIEDILSRKKKYGIDNVDNVPLHRKNYRSLTTEIAKTRLLLSFYILQVKITSSTVKKILKVEMASLVRSNIA